MKTTIRQSVFETNSSSVHTIAIAKNATNLHIPKQISFYEHLDFGWEFDVYNDINTKFTYLINAIDESSWCSEDKKIQKERLDKYMSLLKIRLQELDVTVPQGLPEIIYDTKYHFWSLDGNLGGIDHGDECREFIENILNDPIQFKNFLFDPKSQIITSNDNCMDEEDLPIPTDQEYIFYKKDN